jgi:nucleoside diphosphate kinase
VWENLDRHFERDFGESKGKNVVHRSDSVEAAEKEIGWLFGKEELFG